MLVKIYAPFSGWRMVPPDEAERIHGITVDVDDETAKRWQAALETYHLVQNEMQMAAICAELLLQKRGH
jgi:hypothetical protein